MTPRTAKGNVSVGKVWRWAAYGAVLVIGAAGCGGDDESGASEQAVRSPAQVCDSTLKPPARTALKRIGGTGRYTELSGKQENGEPYRFSLPLAAKRLHSEYLRRNKCAVYRADGKNDFPLLDINIEPSSTVPEKASEAGSREFFFPLGEFASVNSDPGSTYATLFFACTTKGPEGNSPYVKATLYVPTNQARPSSTVEDRMTVLNDVARGLAGELGCADEAALPARVPEPVNG
ncbi:hypothetical protein [Streptomyces sp. NPDC088719]|uniref:hypothetical protein n=1 Tax=Streptomyces sp. NPDC088719 TaxID=3365872 RepID=UPI003815EDE8